MKKEYNTNQEKLKKIRKILSTDLYVRKKTKSIINNLSNRIENLSWHMGVKKYQKREELYDR